MLRTALTPRWLVWLVVVLGLGAGFVLLGLWQMNVAREDAAAEVLREAAARPVLELTATIQPHAAFPADGSNQRVQAVGRFEPARQVLVADRRLAGADGFWVVQPFVVQETGARIPVVRGFVRSLAAADAVAANSAAGSGATEPLTLVGSLAPTESSSAGKKRLPNGQIGSIDVGALLNDWGGEVYNAFLFDIRETPDQGVTGPTGASASGGMERVPPPDLPSGLTLRNAAYALQWWVFAAFGLWMWVKMVRDDYRRHQPVPPLGAGPTADVGATQ